MTFVDTNYFLRFLLRDNEEAYRAAQQLLRDGANGRVKLFTSTLVFFEIFWVLSDSYEKDKKEVISILEDFLKLEFVGLDERWLLKHALALYGEKAIELEDAYHVCYAKECGAISFKTFDKKLQRVV